MGGWLRRLMLLSAAICLALVTAVFLSVATFSLAETPGKGRAVSPAPVGGPAALRRAAAPTPYVARSDALATGVPDRETEAASAERRHVTAMLRSQAQEASSVVNAGPRQAEVRRASADLGVALATPAPVTATATSSQPAPAADQGAGAPASSWPEPEQSLLRAARSTPAAVVEHWAGAVKIEARFFPENSHVAPETGNGPGTRENEARHYREPTLDPDPRQATETTPWREQSGASDAAAAVSQEPPTVSGPVGPAAERGAGDDVAANDLAAPEQGASPAGLLPQREALNEAPQVRPVANGQRTGEWTQAVLALGVALMVAGLAAHLGSARFTRGSPRRVAFWDD